MNSFSTSQAVIAAMITPALLILASGSLIATALARLARVMDRIHRLAELGKPVAAVERARYGRRALLAEQAVRLFFLAIVCFVASGIGIGAAGSNLAWLPVSLTATGMGLIVAGCALMLAECNAARIQIQEEIEGLNEEATRSVKS